MSASAPGALMADEIASQSAVLAGILAKADGDLAAVRDRIAAFAPRFVLIGSRGSSDHAGLYAKYLVEIELGLPAGLASLSTTTLYDATQRLDGCLYLAISQSGRSPDLISATRAARAAGALTVAVTNDIESQLAGVADCIVDIRAGTEYSVAATKTYTAELFAIYLLLVATDADDIPAAVEQVTQAGDERADVLALAHRYQHVERLIVTGRGYSYPSAREAALKLMETCYVSAQAFSGADLLHGPVAVIDASVPVIAFTSPGPGGDALIPVLEQVELAGADLLRIGVGGDLSVPEVAERLRPIVEIIPAQQLALTLARLRGANPDHPRGLSKVTRTC